jgi:3-oxoacyl-[acyl-carrier-protein] synthase-3
MDKYANTAGASIPITMDDMYKKGKFKKGDNLIFAAFGGGFTWGSIYLKWAYNKQ